MPSSKTPSNANSSQHYKNSNPFKNATLQAQAKDKSKIQKQSAQKEKIPSESAI